MWVTLNLETAAETMIRVDVAQGTAEWHKARAGIPTGSQVHRLLTPAKQEYSLAGAKSYRNELLAEWLTGEPVEQNWRTIWSDRGSAEEGDASFWYGEVTGHRLSPGGFVLRDDGLFGGSPDALIVDRDGEVTGGLEIKTPKLAEVVAHLIGERPKAHMGQVQAYCYLMDLDSYDLLIWNSAVPALLETIRRDDAYIARLDAALARFLEFLDHGKAELTRRGYAPKEDAER